MTLKSDIRSADYRAKATMAQEAADRATLTEVRRRHEAAALVWGELADREDRSSATMRAAIDHRLAVQRAAQDTLLAEPAAPLPVGQTGCPS